MRIHPRPLLQQEFLELNTRRLVSDDEAAGQGIADPAEWNRVRQLLNPGKRMPGLKLE